MTITIGIDPHKASHTAVAIDNTEHVLDEIRVRACSAQTDQLRCWATPFPDRVWAIESARGLGYLLAQQLVAAGETVVAACRLHVLLMELHPGGMAKEMTVTRANELLDRAVIVDAMTEHRVAVGREFVEDIDRYDQQMKASRKRLRTAVAASGTTLTDIRGVGVVVAAMIIGHVGNIERFTSAAHFASYNATAPIEASSGENKRHRLNKRGNRQLNWDIHVVAITQLRQPCPGREYYDRKRAEGKNTKEAIRALKRQLSNVIYRSLIADARRLEQ
jgi:transposase